MSGLEHSERSGAPIEPDKPVTVTYVFDDGERREVKVTAAEADVLLQDGVRTTTRKDRAWRAARRGALPLTKWIAVAVVGGFLGQWISDQYSDRQRELELESSLITQISGSSVELFQEAQNAARAPKTPRQIEQRDKAADKWVLASGSITPVFYAYFEGEKVVTHWNLYQAAVYDWAVLGCCTTPDGRREIVARIKTYVDEFIGPPTRKPPVPNPWAALERATPPGGVYQWLGFYLLRGRGKLLSDLKDTSPDLD